jgi:hypothetical protein
MRLVHYVHLFSLLSLVSAWNASKLCFSFERTCTSCMQTFACHDLLLAFSDMLFVLLVSLVTVYWIDDSDLLSILSSLSRGNRACYGNVAIGK